MNGVDKEVIRETVQETLRALGVDATHPVEMQRDFAWLRRNRKVADRIAGKGKVAVVGGIATLVVTLVSAWLLGAME